MKGQHFLFGLVMLVCLFLNSCRSSRKEEESNRRGKLFPVIQLVTFPNDVCNGGTGARNGTCYTSEECNSRGGSSSGTCASGFGVCCVFTIGCNSMIAENNTYIVQTSTTSAPASPCAYTICRSSSDICRIRFDFTTFDIASPFVGTTIEGDSNVAAPTANAGSIGDCITDAFSISSPGNVGSPIICGFNTGQHMIVDASASCNVANFDIGNSGDTRQWEIRVTQYACGTEDRLLGGPDGCLQYFTGTTGTVSSFNFPTTSTAIGATTTHLSNQCYTVCFRQELNFCTICFNVAIVGASIATNPPALLDDTEAAQSSFGLSVSAIDEMLSNALGGTCSNDYIEFQNAVTSSIATATAAVGVNRICGRNFAADANNINGGQTVCTATVPFRFDFKTDGTEVTTGTTAVKSATNEVSLAPGGIVGFSLNFVQSACP